MKIWKEKPSKEEVNALINEYFALLKNGELDKAEALIPSAYDDFMESIFLIWEDHYLIHEIPKDSSYEGKEWLNDLSWLKDLTITPIEEWMNDHLIWVDLEYRGEQSGYIGEFLLHQVDGKEDYTLTRKIFKMA